MRLWILQRYQVYARVVLLIGLAGAPVVFSRRNTVDVFNLFKITWLWVFTLIALALWIVSSAERGVWVPKMKLFWPAAAFLAVMVLATLFSQQTSVSLLGLYHRYGGLVPFLLYGAMALAIVGLYWERSGDVKEVAWACTIASMALTAYVLIQKAGLDTVPWRDSNGLPPAFPVGTMGNSNFAGGYLAVAAPLFAYVVVSVRNRSLKWVLGGAFVLDLLALWYTQTRGAFIALGAAFVVWAFLYRDRLPRWVRLGALAAACLGVVVAVVVVVHPGMSQAPAFFSKADPLSPFRTGTFQDRAYYWSTAFRIFKHHPILGTGPDTYYANYPRFRLPADGAKLGLTITDKPHNIFFEYAANSGILGLGTYLALVGLALWYGYRRVRQLEGTSQLLLVAFMVTLVGYLVNGFFSIDVPPLAMMGWVALAGIAVLADPGAVALRERLEAARQTRGRPQQKKKRTPAAAVDPFRGTRVVRQGSTRWGVHAAAGVLALLLVILGFRPFLADRLAHFAQAAQASPESKPTDVANVYLHASGFQPLEPSYQSQAGAVYEAQGNAATDLTTKAGWMELALGRYRNALKLQPDNVFNMMNLARVYTNWASADHARYPLADTWWRKAIAQDPTDWQVHSQYATMLNAWANAQPSDTALRSRAAAELETVVKIRPDNVDSWINLAKVYRFQGRTSAATAALQEALALSPNNSEARALQASATTTATAGG